jgi:predicted DNA-binding transcriptional regulator YafY/ectoine hydroxylase-related dioxygenase (phytanoyl-CoA dioxygenase family)
MPANRNALIRYKTIDKCLQNRYRTWTLDDLIDACSDALYEYEGIDKGISKRTVQMDIQMMRSEKLGYNAPIIVVDKKFYTYEDSDYSITNIPLTEQDLSKLSETVEILRQFKGFSHFQELDGMVQKLEDHVYSEKTNQKTVIDIEKNENLKGLEFLDVLYQSIIQKKSLKLTYQSFKARQANSFNFHPYYLKEFRNRWFLIGKKDSKKKSPIMNLALDRIVTIEEGEIAFYEDDYFNAETYFKDVIGVSVSPTLEPIEVVLFINNIHAPYVLTKPLHNSQRLISKDYYGVTIALNVQYNFELEKEILSYGDGVKVIAPQNLRRSIYSRLNGAVDGYKTEISESGIKTMQKRLENKGTAILNYVYTQRSVNKMVRIIDKYLKKNTSKTYAKRNLLKEIPELKEILINKNLREIVDAIDPKAFISKAMYFDKPSEANWYVTWHQDTAINVVKKEKVTGYKGWTDKDGVISCLPPEEVSKSSFTIRIHLDDADEKNGALKVIPGSNNKLLDKKSIEIITENSIGLSCNVPAGGVHIMKPLTLHASGKSKSQKRRRVIHLEFTSVTLPGKLKWSEKEEIN